MNEWIKKNEWINKLTQWMNEWIKLTQWKNKQTNIMNEQASKQYICMQL